MKRLAWFGLILVCAAPAFAADRYWVGTNSVSWNSTNNWSANSGGTCGASVPGTADVAIFDGGSSNSCTINAAASVLRVALTSGFTNTLTQGSGITLTVGANGFAQTNGIFVGANAAVTVSGDFSLAGGTFTAPSDILTVSGHFTVSGGTFEHNNGTLRFYLNTGYSTQHIRNISVPTILYLYNLTYDAYGSYGSESVSYTLAAGNTLVVSNTFKATQSGAASADARVLMKGGTIEAKGNVICSSASPSQGPEAGSTVLLVNGNSAQQYDYTRGMLPVLKIDTTGSFSPASGTTNLATGYFVLTNGTFNAPSGTWTVYAIGEGSIAYFQWTGGTFNPNNGTLRFYTVPNYQRTLTWAFSLPAVVYLGGLTFDGNGENWGVNYAVFPIPTETTLIVSNDFTMTGNGAQSTVNGGTIRVQGNLLFSSANGEGAGGGTSPIVLDGVGDQTVTHLGGTPAGGAWKIDKASGTVKLASALNLSTSGQDLLLTNGTLDLAGYNLTVKDVFDADKTLRLKGSELVTAGTLNLDATQSSVIYYDSAVTAVITNFPATNFWDLTLGGDYKMHAFKTGTTYTVNGTLATTGDKDHRAYLRSMVDGVPWRLRYLGTAPLGAAVNVRDSDASSGNTVSAIGAADMGGNVNWSFGASPGLDIANRSASDIQAPTATLNGFLSSTGGSPAQVKVVWGRTDMGRTLNGWEHTEDLGYCGTGVLSRSVVGMESDQTHYYRFYATNGAEECWATPATAVAVPFTASSYARKMKITLQYDRDEVLTNFPALVVFSEDISRFDYGDFASEQAADLRFRNAADTAILNYEIDKWNTAGSSYIWVQVDRLTSTSNWIWAYYGSPLATPRAYTTNGSTWTEGYLGVWHLQAANGTGAWVDSTVNAFPGVGANVTPVNGQIAGAANFAAANADINLTGLASTAQKYTFEYWLKTASTSTDGRFIDIQSGRLIMGHNAGGLRYYDQSSTWRPTSGGFGTGFNDNTWRYVVYTFSATFPTGSVYVAGSVLTNAVPYTAANIGGRVRLGSDNNLGGADYTGLMDEFRISTVVRSSNWVWACYMNTASNAVFSAYEVQGGSGTIIFLR